VDKRNKIQGVMFFIALCVLSAHLAVSYYIGTTSLLGAFLAGVMLSSVPVHLHKEDESRTIDHLAVFRDYAGPVQDHVLAPLFFASIGYTIPFLSLFKSTLIWQGVVYSVFMCVGKVLVGFVVYLGLEPILSLTGRVVRGNRTLPTKQLNAGEHDLNRIETEEGRTGRFEDAPPEVTSNGSSPRSEPNALPARPSLTERVTLGAALGTALVARGEIGILILQVAYSKSQLASPEAPDTLLSEDVYLIGIWAVALCTIVGPVAFAGLMRSERFRACIS
jgi:Kef-type K+ transport system membrane component KefB